MGIADRHGLPFALRTERASPAEVTPVEKTLEERIVAEVPERLIEDKTYDSDRLDQQLMHNYGTDEMASRLTAGKNETLFAQSRNGFCVNVAADDCIPRARTARSVGWL